MKKLADLSLSVVVNYVRGNTAKCRWATEVTVKMCGLDVAKGTLGGRYTQAQALAEFKRNPKRFTLFDAYSMAQAARLVA